MNAATGKKQTIAMLEDGSRVMGDVLVGTDGIWSKIRKQLIGETPASYSQYTCYTGISDYVPAEIDLVGYRVFLGNGQYFVSSDVGDGKMQWWVLAGAGLHVWLQPWLRRCAECMQAHDCVSETPPCLMHASMPHNMY